jgi:ribonuclease HII
VKQKRTKTEPSRLLKRRLPRGSLVVGLDEAGRGPLAGPVVAAAVVLHPRRRIAGLDDSKKLGLAERERLFPLICERALAWGVAASEPDRIDEMNILRASMDAMRVAFEACEAMLGTVIHGAIVDGNLPAPLPERVVQRPTVDADALSPPVMAASILAKVTRDRRMIEEAARFPGYGFEQHKGYPTPAHREALMRLGPCPIHRRSFGTVKKALQAAGAGS